MISFAVHQVRAGQAGASEDFEQMLGLLVRATSGRKANLVFANPGDWGIDVLVGDLRGRVTVWQAKYFARGVGRSQQGQIRSSFASAVKAAADHGYTLERWVLCIPVSMDGPTTQWWYAWESEQEQATGVAIDLWDEITLRELLLGPEAADVYRHYYAPSLWRASAGAADTDVAFRTRLAQAAEELAAAVSSQWRQEERLRRIQDPVPLPVRWTTADPLLSDHAVNIHRIPGDAIQLDGSLHKAVEIFTQIPSRRLVVVGQAGAGKTVFALRFTLDLLARRKPGDPVPVIFSLHTWNPLEQPLHEWMSARLAADYPALRNASKPGETIASELVRRQRILPVLDGLDEVSQSVRGDAMRALNMSLDNGAPVVLTCRESDYRQVVGDADVLTSAAVVQLLPLQLSDLADYLPRTTRKTPAAEPGEFTTKWDPLLQRMHTDPDEPACRVLLEVLATPLMTSLARSVYSDTAADPAVLLSGKFADDHEVEAHLLDGFIPAAFAGPLALEIRRRRRSPRGQDAERWLTFLARHLNRLGTRDLEWWRLQDAVPSAIRWVASGLVAWLSLVTVSVIAGTGQGWAARIAVAACAAAGLMLGLAIVTARLPSTTQDRGTGRLGMVLRRLCYSAAAAVPAGLFLGFIGNLNPDGPGPGGVRGQIIVLAYSLVGGLGVGIVLGAAGIDSQVPMTTPLRLRRKFRALSRRLFYGIGHGLLNGLLVGFAAWVSWALMFCGAAGLRIAATPEFPSGGTGIGHVLGGGGIFSDYPDNLRYVIGRNGGRYIESIRKIAFYTGGPDGNGYLSRADCLSEEKRQCRSHVPEIIYYDSLGNSIFATAFPSNYGLQDNNIESGTMMSWLNPPQLSKIIRGYVIDTLFIVTAVAVIGSFIGIFFLWLGYPADAALALTPSSTLRTDRNAAIFRSAVISFLILVAYVPIALSSRGPWKILEVGVLLSMTFGLMALTFSPWVRLQVGGIWLAARGQLPWRAMRFLEDAHARGALRQAGAAYQFRHARLQEQLVARARNTQRPIDDRSSYRKPDDPAIGDEVPQASVR